MQTLTDLAHNPRGGNTTTRTRIVPRGTAGAHAIERGRRWQIIYTLTPFALVATTVVDILGGRPVANADRAAALIAEFDATADLSPAHSMFVAAIHNIAAENPFPTDPLADYDIEWPVHEAFDASFSRV